MWRILLVVVVLVVALLVAACIVPSADPTYTFSVQSNVVYGQGEVDGGGVFDDLLLDLYVPNVPAGHQMPVMLMLHGGGFIGGSKTNGNVVASAQHFAQRGYLVASIDYRLQGDDPIPSARMAPLLAALGGSTASPISVALLSSIDDTLSALEYLQARDDVFPPWTVLWGSSAGAITSLMTAYILDDYGIERPPVAGVIDLWGGLYGLGVGNPFDDPAKDPVLFIVHGTADTVVPYSLTQAIFLNLLIAGGPISEIHPIDGAGHGVNLFTTEARPGVSLQQRSVEFLAQTVFAGLPEGPIGNPTPAE